ncbi:MAG UNVERIFIED_CONTAM: hypothetical protein LVR18_39745 [Planctomycetaceae bacterium]|jgi:hypothetical protein
MKQALSEATANAIAKATDESHITELAQLLAAMPNDISLTTLDAYAGPENKFVADCEQQVRSYTQASTGVTGEANSVGQGSACRNKVLSRSRELNSS